MRKLSIESIRSHVESEGYQLLTTDYLGNNSKMELLCPLDHNISISWNNWSSKGIRCKYCSDRRYLKIDEVRQIFKEKGHEMISDVYVDTNTEIIVKCSNNHTYKTTMRKVKCGYGCIYCSGKLKNSIEHIGQVFGNEGYTLLTDVYINNKEPMEYICPIGHHHKMTWNSWQRGSRCGICNKVPDMKKVDFEVIRKSFYDEGYELITDEYSGSKQKLEFICPRGHKHNILWSNWEKGSRCGKCGISGPESHVLSYIRDTYKELDVISGDRTQIINPYTNRFLELDIWIPTLNKAVEVNGVYYHGEGRPSFNRDKLKKMICEDKGIDLLTFSDIEWYKDTNNIKSKIHSFIRGEVV